MRCLPMLLIFFFFNNVATPKIYTLSLHDALPILDPEIARPILKEVNDRLRFLSNVGLEYLTLGRSAEEAEAIVQDRKSTRLNSSHLGISYAVFCLKKKILKCGKSRG